MSPYKILPPPFRSWQRLPGVQSGDMGDTGKCKHQGKKDLGWGGGRGQGARRSIAGIGREKNPKASLRQEASRRPPGENPTA